MVGDSRGLLYQFDTATGEHLMETDLHTDWVTDVSWSSDGGYIVSPSRDWSVRIYDTHLQEMVGGFLGHQARVYASVFDEGDEHVLSFGLEPSAQVGDSKAKKTMGINQAPRAGDLVGTVASTWPISNGCDQVPMEKRLKSLI